MMGTVPSSTRSVADCPMPWNTKLPSPPPPISAATVTRPMFCTRTMRMPVRTMGAASGSSTVRSRCRALMPIPRAASTACRGTCSSPITVLATTGSSEYRNRAMTAGAVPMPRMPRSDSSGNRAASSPSGTIISPYMAMLGIVCTTFRTGSVTARSRPPRAQAIPSGTPTATAAASDPKASSTCLAASRQNVSACEANSFRTDRPSHHPDPSTAATTTTVAASTPRRTSGPGASLASVSAASIAKAVKSSQKPLAGATRAKVLPAGTTKPGTSPIATARVSRAIAAARPRSPIGLRQTATPRAATRIMAATAPSGAGREASRPRPLPDAIRFGRKVAKGCSTRAGTASAPTSSPTRSRRAGTPDVPARRKPRGGEDAGPGGLMPPRPSVISRCLWTSGSPWRHRPQPRRSPGCGRSAPAGS